MKREDYCNELKTKAYAKRIGQVYGDFKVKSIRYDEIKKKQEWTLVCEKCGRKKITTSWQNYTNGKSGRCKCSKNNDIELKSVEKLDKVKKKAYQDRIGKVYGDYTVIDVLWDSEKRKQLWVLQCNYCGVIKPTYSWQNYVNGRSGHCKRCNWAGSVFIGVRENEWDIVRHWIDDYNNHHLLCKCYKCGKTIISDLLWYKFNKCNCEEDNNDV